MGAIALLGGNDALAVSKSRPSTAQAQDAEILNTALGAELEAIAAYQVGAESGLLSKPVLDLAVQFQGHHKEHAEALAGAVTKLGGTPLDRKRITTSRRASLRLRATSSVSLPVWRKER